MLTLNNRAFLNVISTFLFSSGLSKTIDIDLCRVTQKMYHKDFELLSVLEVLMTKGCLWFQKLMIFWKISKRPSTPPPATYENFPKNHPFLKRQASLRMGIIDMARWIALWFLKLQVFPASRIEVDLSLGSWTFDLGPTFDLALPPFKELASLTMLSV